MTLDALLQTITQSTRDDWEVITCWGGFTGPSYKNQFTFWNKYDGQNNVLMAEQHGIVAAYKPDISISIALSLKCVDDFKEEWANEFPDPKASSHFFDLFYNNALVFRGVYVEVDGGRAKLPIPHIVRDEETHAVTALQVPTQYCDMVRLLDTFESTPSFDEYFRRAGMTGVDEPWT